MCLKTNKQKRALTFQHLSVLSDNISLEKAENHGNSSLTVIYRRHLARTVNSRPNYFDVCRVSLLFVIK
jgi:tRNA(Glu) U13 pseudouridine synthase TruD